MGKKPENNEKKRLLRLPKKLDKAIEDRAEANKRSVNSQIIFELEQIEK